MKTLATLLLSCCLLSAYSQSISFEPKNASCQDICDGQITLKGLNLEGDASYDWRPASEVSFKDLESNRISKLCKGHYELRIKRPIDIDISAAFIDYREKDGHIHLKNFSVNTLGAKNIEFRFDLAQEVMNLAEYMTVYYSIDGGHSWRDNIGLYQETETKGGKTEVSYLMKLPKIAHNRENVLIDMQQLTPKKKNGVPLFNLLGFKCGGMIHQYLSFEVDADDPMEIRSTVSNELNGNDGYIDIQVFDGKPPYSYHWEHGSSANSLKYLSPGKYTINVTDKSGCKQTAAYEIMSKNRTSNSTFDLSANEDGVYILSVKELHRQPLNLSLTDENGKVVKSFRINPLYEDLRMELDLSFMFPGTYSVQLKGPSFSKTNRLIVP